MDQCRRIMNECRHAKSWPSGAKFSSSPAKSTPSNAMRTPSIAMASPSYTKFSPSDSKLMPSHAKLTLSSAKLTQRNAKFSSQNPVFSPKRGGKPSFWPDFTQKGTENHQKGCICRSRGDVSPRMLREASSRPTGKQSRLATRPLGRPVRHPPSAVSPIRIPAWA